MPLTVAEQFRILLEWSSSPQSLRSVAQATGLTPQALAKLLAGHAANPRLQTLRALCGYYGIALDYFDCATIADCQAYLYAARCNGSPLLSRIESDLQTLSPRGQRNVLVVLEWMQRATTP